MAELHFVTTVELKCLFATVNRIKYTPIANIVDYFTNVSRISRPIECTSLVTWIAMNLGYSDLAYIEGGVPVLGLDHFVHAHILREEPDYSVSMLYGHKAIQLPNPALLLYSYEILHYSFIRWERHATASQDRIALACELIWSSTVDYDYTIG
jgi:hypothetical protein